ncbi:response regulator [Desulfotomaculum defluvii]
MAKLRLLIVDDSPFIHKNIKKALPADKFDICGVAQNGKEGLELFFSLNPDVVTMDITMPVMDGLEAAEAILARDKRARIIMLSAMGDEELIEKAKAIGVRAFLQKPFKADEMMTAIKRVFV